VELDARVVRAVLVPALMLVIGDGAWRLPTPLGRLLPRLSIEAPAPNTPLATPESA
jgi:RND superfamily putative drug exporter